MKEFRWSLAKNIELQKTRHVTFEVLLDSRFIGMEDHARKEHQRLMLFEYNGYVWVVPFVADKDHYFLMSPKGRVPRACPWVNEEASI